MLMEASRPEGCKGTYLLPQVHLHLPVLQRPHFQLVSLYIRLHDSRCLTNIRATNIVEQVIFCVTPKGEEVSL